MFRLARQERDIWVTWPARVAVEVKKQSGSPVNIEVATMQMTLEAHVRNQLEALADLRVSLG